MASGKNPDAYCLDFERKIIGVRVKIIGVRVKIPDLINQGSCKLL